MLGHLGYGVGANHEVSVTGLGVEYLELWCLAFKVRVMLDI